MSTVAMRLKAARAKSALTQNDVANRTGINRATLANWETGRTEPDLNSLKVLAELYKVSSDYILGNTDIPDPIRQNTVDPDEPTPAELEKVLKEANIMFDGAPLDEDDKNDVIEFIKVALRQIKKRKRERGEATD
ncbi:helix-turn-helix domain-containing protein [Desulfolucanica intricata]|uniref:helix-turn-helix domain-containing protein n=1 Tax=Desulfolucanica intricata TaxID=1285191 RepID=UPI00082E6F87|nr:helix-turn-helix transcriptional regulator [Desulfolucanica intricata]